MMSSKKISRRGLFTGQRKRPSSPEPFLERFYRERRESPVAAPSFVTNPSAWKAQVETSPVGMEGVTPAVAYYEDTEDES